MQNKPLLAVAVSLALVAMASPAAADHFGDADRDTIYIGASNINHGLNEHWTPACEAVFGDDDCPTPIPGGLIWASCDDSSFWGQGIYQGHGGALFCAIPNTATFGVAIHDALIDPVVAWVSCLESEGEVNWHRIMGAIDGSGTFDLSEDCPAGEPGQHSEDPAGTTRVGIFNLGPPDGAGATTGDVTLNFL